MFTHFPTMIWLPSNIHFYTLRILSTMIHVAGKGKVENRVEIKIKRGGKIQF